jgi:tetratricopeptide (TPR) repeat protein
MRIQTSLLVLAILASPAAADRKQRKAKAHMEKAAKASSEGRNEDALKELDAAYALDPQPNLVLARATVLVKLDRCEEAIKLYDEFLATNPVPEIATMATDASNECKAKLAPPPPPEPPPPEPPPPTVVTSEEINADTENPTLQKAKPQKPVQREQAVTAKVETPAPRRWFTDPIMIGLGVGGVASIAAGVFLYTSARGKLDDAEAAASYDGWKTGVDDAKQLRLFAIIGGAAGALFAGGAVFYYLQAYGGEEEPRVTLIPTRGGGVVGWTGRF